MIEFSAANKTFYINTQNTSYVFRVCESGLVNHLYYGGKIRNDDISFYNLFGEKAYSSRIVVDGKGTSIDAILQEYPTFGRGDYRESAIDLIDSNGRSICELKYKNHEITDGSPELEGMPHLESKDCKTLKLTLEDEVLKLQVHLYYTVFYSEDIIARHTVIENCSDESISITKAASLSLDILDGKDLEIIDLYGAWGRERWVERVKLNHGCTEVGSKRGAGGHQSSPFMAVVSPDASEDFGSVYATALVYSGNHLINVEKNQYNSLRLQAGINPYNFSWRLNSGETFTTPQAILTYSSHGLTKMSHNFHNACRKYLGKSAEKELKRPIVLNNWEATYFNFNEEKIVSLIDKCKGLGIDTFVLDDGWFGCRNSDNCSLGDWYIDTNKLPNGLTPLIEACKRNGMKFGLWFEPEMISKNSDLYRLHPDWCIHTPDRETIESRQQLVLDYSNDEVVEYIYEVVSKILRENDIRYVKWDMNRNITDNGSVILPKDRQGEHAHRYILGVYKLMSRLTGEFSNVLFEGCAGGGGRFDFGVLYYMPQIWCSDDTDAMERLSIQYGTSLVYPLSAISAHVSACPNHQTGRITPFKTRGDVAMLANFGYELDITKLDDATIEQIKEQTAVRERLDDLIASGDFYRLISPFDNNTCAWQVVSEDKKHAYAMFSQKMSVPNNPGYVLRFKGLDDDVIYNVKELGINLSGAALKNAGIPIMPAVKDYWTCTFEFTAI